MASTSTNVPTKEKEPDSNSKTSKTPSNKSKIPSKKTLSKESIIKLADEGPVATPKAKGKNVPKLNVAKTPKKVTKSDLPPPSKVPAGPVPVPGIPNAGSSIISKKHNNVKPPRPSVRPPDPEKTIGTKNNATKKNIVTSSTRNNSTLSKVPDEGLKPKKNDLSHNPPHDRDRDGSPAPARKDKTSIVKKQEGGIDDYNAADDDPFSHAEKYVQRRGTVKLTKAAYYQLYQTPISAKRIYHMKRFDPTYISEDKDNNKSKTPAGNFPDESEDQDDQHNGTHKESQHFKTSSRAGRVCCFFTKTTVS